MASAIGTALSGLTAAGARIGVAANNIANQSSTKSVVNGAVTDTPYAAQRVDQVSLSSGGVQAIVNNVDPASQQVPDVTSETGLSAAPNVNEIDSMMQLQLASYDFKANLSVIKAQQKLDDSLLNILS